MQLYLSQFDSRWADKKIGNSGLSLGRFGCTITCLSMSLSDFGVMMLPPEIASRTDWFTKGGLIIWAQVEKGLRDMLSGKTVSLRRYYGRNDGAIRQNLRPGSGVLLEVANGSHWVKVDRKMLFRNDYNCRDPWRGKGCAAIGDYRNITGYAILKIS